ncbi:HNH endonuclease [Nonomuraea dietziae]|uniref:HNH endonuclease n=1 Tax=Nonomuraea dietziae TaxID=65515 RepID=UPI0034170430
MKITLSSAQGHLAHQEIEKLHLHWHIGVRDRMSVSGGGVSWHARAGKWAAQVKVAGRTHYLGLHGLRQDAEAAVSEFRARNPSHRVRKLESVRRNQARCYDEVSWLARRAPIDDIVEWGVAPMVRLVTQGGRVLVCAPEQDISTPGGWRPAHSLRSGDEVMIGTTAARPSQALVPPLLRQGIGVWTTMQRERLIEEVDVCYCCHRRFARDELALDHVIPVALDLTRALDEGNLAPACLPCHRVKTDSEQALARRGGKIAVAGPERVAAVEPQGPARAFGVRLAPGANNLLAGGILVRAATLPPPT